MTKTKKLIKAPIPKKSELFFIRVIILCALGYGIYFAQWFFHKEIIDNAILFSFISITIVYRLLRLGHQWTHLFFLSTIDKSKTAPSDFKVDVFTTFVPGEPYELIEHTLSEIVKIKYPHNTILCSEGDDERLRAFCDNNHIKFIPRFERINAKAGNINHALQYSDADICVILDPDHSPTEDFIDMVLPYFQDEEVGFVQVPQIYDNQDNSVVAKGAAQQTYEFYGPLMQASNQFGTTPAIGANCTFRRTALDSIGGHAPGLTEDMHTSMLLHNKGWKSIFVPVVVSHGMVPVNLSSYYKQQLKWSRGSFDLFFKVYPKIFKNLTWSQRFHYLSVPLYFFFGLFILFDFLVPSISLFFGEYPLKCRMDDLVVMVLPLVALSFYIKVYAQKWYYEKHEKGFHFYGEVLRFSTWWINLLGLWYTIVGRNVPYIPTPKEDVAQNEIKISIPNIILVLVLGSSIVVGLNRDWSSSSLIMSIYLGSIILVISIGILFGLGKWLKTLKNRMANSISSVGFSMMKILSFPFVIITLLSNVIYFTSVRDKVHSLYPITPPDIKNTGGYYLYCGSEEGGNVNYHQVDLKNLNISTINKEIQEGKFPVIRSWKYFKDSTDLVNTLDSFHLEDIKGNFFLDILKKHDSISIQSYKHQWKVLNSYFYKKGIHPTYVFSCSGRGELRRHYPDSRFVDWILLDIDSEEELDIYKIIDQTAHDLVLKKKPVFVHLAKSIKRNIADQLLFDFKEIKGLLCDEKLDNPGVELVENKQFSSESGVDEPNGILSFKGIYYNVAQDWKDDFQTLTTKSIRYDFKRIGSLGVNTILRYGPTIGDRNIIESAKKADMELFYGIQMEPSMDFTDEQLVEELKSKTIKLISKYKKYDHIKCWILGNELFDKLNNYYSMPYTYIQQIAYLKFISDLSTEINKIDKRPVAVHFALNQRTIYTVKLFQRYCSNVDLVGWGVYSLNDFKFLKLVDLDADRQYLSSFGTAQYSDFNMPNIKKIYDLDSTLVSNIPMEMNYLEKNEYLQKSVDSLSKYTISGGFVNCWSDKMSGSITWNGVADYKGRLKPTYYSLQNVWNPSSIKPDFPNIEIVPEDDYYLEDSVYIFSADIEENKEFNTVNWLLTRSGTIPLGDKYILEADGNTVKIKLPNNKEDLDTYVLFLFVEDEKGENVITDSYLLPLRWYYK